MICSNVIGECHRCQRSLHREVFYRGIENREYWIFLCSGECCFDTRNIRMHKMFTVNFAERHLFGREISGGGPNFIMRKCSLPLHKCNPIFHCKEWKTRERYEKMLAQIVQMLVQSTVYKCSNCSHWKGHKHFWLNWINRNVIVDSRFFSFRLFGLFILTFKNARCRVYHGNTDIGNLTIIKKWRRYELDKKSDRKRFSLKTIKIIHLYI